MQFSLTSEVVEQIQAWRHEMRLNGARGACYEVSQLIELKWSFPAKEGVYESQNGEPIFLHRWNVLPTGEILDGTADQFGEKLDVVLLSKAKAQFTRYRPIWTKSFRVC